MILNDQVPMSSALVERVGKKKPFFQNHRSAVSRQAAFGCGAKGAVLGRIVGPPDARRRPTYGADARDVRSRHTFMSGQLETIVRKEMGQDRLSTLSPVGRSKVRVNVFLPGCALLTSMATTSPDRGQICESASRAVRFCRTQRRIVDGDGQYVGNEGPN